MLQKTYITLLFLLVASSAFAQKQKEIICAAETSCITTACLSSGDRLS